MKQPVAAKHRPDRFTEMSGRMAAIVGDILGVRFGDSAIAEIVATSDGNVLARTGGEAGTTR